MYCMSNGIVKELKSHRAQSIEWIRVYYKPICMWMVLSIMPVTVTDSIVPRVSCTNSATRQLKSAQMDCLLCYMVTKQAFEYKTKGICLQTQPKQRDLFVSK